MLRMIYRLSQNNLTPKVRELDVREVVNRNAELRAERTRQKLTREFGNRGLGYMRLKMEGLE
jgi:hypothetical protein